MLSEIGASLMNSKRTYTALGVLRFEFLMLSWARGNTSTGTGRLALRIGARTMNFERTQ
jgi:hypothetical protein